MLLAGDVGGTKTHLALISPEAGPRAPVAEAVYRSASFPDLETIISTFLLQTNGKVDRACLGVAGPVLDGNASITNLPWTISEKELRQKLALEDARLINDLQAMAYALPQLRPVDLQTLQAGDPQAGGAMAVIAPGTGLGQAYLTWDGSRFIAHPSEGGHCDLAPTNPTEGLLLEYLRRRLGHVSFELACSGMGMPHIYAFYRDAGIHPEPHWLRDQLAEAEDHTPIIVANAMDREAPCPLCVATLCTFVNLLGAEAGNLALKVLATGGVFLAGGIPPRILPWLRRKEFLNAFHNKGKMKGLLQRIPLRVVLNADTALLGAAFFGLETLLRPRP